jgi:DNA (cytosine-5)-methyltransferase 1
MIDFVSVNGGGNCSIAAARDAMGIDWMNKGELNEAIPPAYTEFIGKQLAEHLKQSKTCSSQEQRRGFGNFSLITSVR